MSILKTSFILFFSVIILFLTSTLFARCAYSSDFTLIDIKEVSIDYKLFTPHGRDPLITSWGNHKLDRQLDLNLNMNVLDWFYWNNRIHSMTNESQFFIVGWEFRGGVYLTKYLEFGLYHFSRHVLDSTYPYDGFPVQDAIEIKLNLIKKEY